MPNNISKEKLAELKITIFAKEAVRRIYSEIKDVPTIAKLASEMVSKKEAGRFVSEETVKKFIAEFIKDALIDEQGIDAEVDQMLKSIGQSLDENEQKKEIKRKALFNKNSPENHLKYCEVCVDKEAEREANYE